MMDVTMPKDFLPELLTNMQKQLDRIEGKTDDQSADIAEIKTQTLTTQHGLEQAQRDIKKMEKTKGKRLNLEPRTLYLLMIASLIVLGIVAKVVGVNVEGLFK